MVATEVRIGHPERIRISAEGDISLLLFVPYLHRSQTKKLE